MNGSYIYAVGVLHQGEWKSRGFFKEKKQAFDFQLEGNAIYEIKVKHEIDDYYLQTLNVHLPVIDIQLRRKVEQHERKEI